MFLNIISLLCSHLAKIKQNTRKETVCTFVTAKGKQNLKETNTIFFPTFDGIFSRLMMTISKFKMKG